MKNSVNKYITLVFFCLLILASCSKDTYQDSGRFENNFQGTVLDYLKTRPELFDSLNKVIKLAGMENELQNNEVTFFAPSDISIASAVKHLNRALYVNAKDTVSDLNQIPANVWKEFLGMYLFDKGRMLKDYPQLDTLNFGVFAGQGYVSTGGHNMNIGVIYNDVISDKSGEVPQVVKYAGYRQLYLSYVGVTAGAGGANFMVNAPVATSDIKTKNGVLHVLNFRKHGFGFDNFVLRAYNQL